MEFQTFLNLSVAVGGIVAPIIWKSLTDRIKTAESKVEAASKELNDFRVKVAEDYPSRQALRDLLQPIMDELQKIDQKLDGKQDKP